MDDVHGMGAGRGRRGLWCDRYCGVQAMMWVVGVVVCAAIVWCVP